MWYSTCCWSKRHYWSGNEYARGQGWQSGQECRVSALVRTCKLMAYIGIVAILSFWTCVVMYIPFLKWPLTLTCAHRHDQSCLGSRVWWQYRFSVLRGQHPCLWSLRSWICGGCATQLWWRRWGNLHNESLMADHPKECCGFLQLQYSWKTSFKRTVNPWWKTSLKMYNFILTEFWLKSDLTVFISQFIFLLLLSIVHNIFLLAVSKSVLLFVFVFFSQWQLTRWWLTDGLALKSDSNAIEGFLLLE